MKRPTAFIAAAAAILTLAGCGSPSQNTSAPSASPETSPAPAVTEALTTTAAEATPETSVTPDEHADDEGKTRIFDIDGRHGFFLEDGTPDEWGMLSFDSAVVRYSTGVYHDSDTEPDLFVPDEFIYLGENVGLGGTRKIKAGDVTGGFGVAAPMTVKSASTVFMAPYNDAGEPDFTLTEGWMPFGSEVKLEGTLTLTGIVRYFYDEQYTISSGDIHFIPDSSYAGLPMSFDIAAVGGVYGDSYEPEFAAKNFDVAGDWDNSYYGGGVCVYSDAPRFRVGNLGENYAGDAAMSRLFDGGGANCTKKVEITLSDITLSWSDQFGTSRCSAVIDSIKEI